MNASAVGSNTSKVREAMEHGMSLRCGPPDKTLPDWFKEFGFKNQEEDVCTKTTKKTN